MLHGAERDGKVRSPKHSGASHTEFEIRRWLEVDFCTVDHRLMIERTPNAHHRSFGALRLHKVMPGHLPYPEFDAIRTQVFENARQLPWDGLVNAKHVHGHRVVTFQKRIAIGSEPQALLAKGSGPAFQVQRYVCIQQPELVEGGNCLSRRWRLEVGYLNGVLH